jgi:hypothetical protein
MYYLTGVEKDFPLIKIVINKKLFCVTLLKNKDIFFVVQQLKVSLLGFLKWKNKNDLFLCTKEEKSMKSMISLVQTPEFM